MGERVLGPFAAALPQFLRAPEFVEAGGITRHADDEVRRVLRDVRTRRELRVLDAVPRYYPSLRWILAVPGLREVATWNCLIMVEKRRTPPSDAPAGGSR